MPWFKAQAGEENSADIWINSQIGIDWWTGDGTTASGFISAVEALGEVDTINLRINSPGGDVADGLTIFNYLRNHKAKVIVTVEGIAASIASVIAMAGDEIIMGLGTTMMVHNPWTWASGNANDFRKMADDLDTIASGLMDAYALKSGKSHEEIKVLLDGETYMTAKEAVEFGFADREDVELKAAASANMGEIKISAQFTAELKARDGIIGSLESQIEVLEKSAKPLQAADAKEVVALCAKNKLDVLANGLISDGSTLEATNKRIEKAKSIQSILTNANIDAAPAMAKIDDAAALISYALNEQAADLDLDQDSNLSPGAGTSKAKAPNAVAAYAQQNNQ